MAGAARMAGRFASRARFCRPPPPRRAPSPFSFEKSSALPRPRPSVRREMISMLPLHNATASARLVSLISSGSESLECEVLFHLFHPSVYLSSMRMLPVLEVGLSGNFQASATAIRKTMVAEKCIDRNAERSQHRALVISRFFHSFSRSNARFLCVFGAFVVLFWIRSEGFRVLTMMAAATRMATPRLASPRSLPRGLLSRPQIAASCARRPALRLRREIVSMSLLPKKCKSTSLAIAIPGFQGFPPFFQVKDDG